MLCLIVLHRLRGFFFSREGPICRIPAGRINFLCGSLKTDSSKPFTRPNVLQALAPHSVSLDILEQHEICRSAAANCQMFGQDINDRARRSFREQF